MNTLFFLAALEVVFVIIYLIFIPGDPKNSVLLGFSAQRLAMIFIMVALGVINLVWGIRSRYKGSFPDRWISSLLGRPIWVKGIEVVFWILALTGWTFTWMPAYWVRDYGAYLERLRPILTWIMFVSGQWLVGMAIHRGSLSMRKIWSLIKTNNQGIRATLYTVACMGVIWGLVAFTGIGLKPDETYWNDLGIPLLGLQVLLAVCSVVIAGWVGKKLKLLGHFRFSDTVILFLIWAVAAFSWINTPADKTYFSPGPYPPNMEVYPFSDAAGYDISAQYGLIGQGFSDFKAVDKPLYTFILFILHLIGGENYPRIIALQAGLLALIPALVYWLGIRMGSRLGGILAAVLLILKEMNAYETGVYIQATHSKVFMSEFPLALIMVVFVICMVAWFDEKRLSTVGTIAAGGTLGLGTLLRHNTWLLLPVVLIAVFVRYGKDWRTAAKRLLLFGSMFIISILPWMVRNGVYLGKPFYFLDPLRGVVWEDRYLPVLEPTTNSKPTLKPTQKPTARVSTKLPAKTKTKSVVVSTKTVPAKTVALKITALPGPVEETNAVELGLDMAEKLGMHYFHNLVAATFIFPTDLPYNNLRYNLQAENSPWRDQWKGDLSQGMILMIGVNLILLSIGIGFSWSRYRWAGLVPLWVFLVYTAATAVARTSGGRYIIPVDWILVLYYSLGMIRSISWLATLMGFTFAVPEEDLINSEIQSSTSNTTRGILAAAAFLVIGTAIPVSEHLIPVRYSGDVQTQAVNVLENQRVFERTGWSLQEYKQFAKEKQSVVMIGRLLYPRYYRVDEGEPSWRVLERPRNFKRLTFYVLGSKLSNFILPLEKDPGRGSISQSSDILVLGCQNNQYTEAIALIDLNNGHILLSNTKKSLKCVSGK